MAVPLFLMVLLASDAADAATSRIMLRDDLVRVGDLALVAEGAEMVVTRLPAKHSVLTLTEAQRRDLLQRRVPGGDLRLRHRGTVALEKPAAPPRTEGSCYVARVDLAPGAYLSRDDVAETACARAPVERRLRYDAEAGAAFAYADIPAGTPLGRLRVAAQDPIAAGQAMLLRTRVGPVTIERRVTSLQPARPGKRLFVRTEDGQLLASGWTDPATDGDR